MKPTEQNVFFAPPGSDGGRGSETTASSINRLLKQRFPNWPDVWAACVQRTHAWRTPPRWSPRDWLEELDAESIASACHAIRIFDPDRGPSLESFVYHRILSGALSRYRKEWSYALRCIRSPALTVKANGTDEIDDRDAAAVEEKRIRRSMIDLPDQDKRLIECLFWEGRTEKDIAGGLGITQQAVNKRKRKILVQLRTNLANASPNQMGSRDFETGSWTARGIS